MISAADAWLALVLSLPTSNATARMRIWRALKTLGCGALRDGVYLLPDGAAALQALAELARTAQQSGGEAQVLRVSSVDAQQDAALRALFDRSEQYRELVAAAKTAAGDAAHRRRRCAPSGATSTPSPPSISSPARREPRRAEALADLEAALSPAASRARRPAASAASTAADYQGRTWATRQHLWVDRMASAWLIRRFIDRKAQLPLARQSEELPAGGAGLRLRRRRLHPRRRPRHLRGAGGELRPRRRPRARAHRRASCTTSMSAACRWPRRRASRRCWPGCAPPRRRRRRAAGRRRAASSTASTAPTPRSTTDD